MIRAAFVIALLAAFGCTSQSPEHLVNLMVLVQDENQMPVGRASIAIDGQNQGTTDLEGRFRAKLSGPEHRLARVGVSCPDDLVGQGPIERPVTVRFLKPLNQKEAPLAPLDVTFTCTKPTRKHVVLVRTNTQIPFPVKMLGTTVTNTSDTGVAQFVVEGLPGDELEVTLDTSAAPDLRPASPTRRFKIPETSQLIVFDQTFKKKIEETKKRTRQRRGPRRL